MATPNSYVVGDLVRVSAVFKVGSTLTNPGAVTVTVTKPDGTTSTPTVTNDSTGNYHADIDTTSGRQGVWKYAFSGTNPAQAANYTTFWVDDPTVTN